MKPSELMEILRKQVELHDDLDIGFVNAETGEELEIVGFDEESGMIIGR